MTYDRWNPPRETVATEKPIKIVMVDGAGESSVEPRGKTWGIRERGDRTGTVVHAYRCPVHGLFDARVSRSEVPDEVVCPAEFEDPDGAVNVLGERMSKFLCGEMGQWAGSFCGQGKAAGEVCS